MYRGNICHVEADGRSFNHFMKAWASIFRSGRNSAEFCLEKSMPWFDRNAIKEKDPCGLESMFCNECLCWASNWDEYKVPVRDLLPNKVRATFIMGQGDVERLKRYVLDQCSKTSETEQKQLHVSTFVVTCALVWTCLIKAQEGSSGGSEKDEDDDEF